MKTIGHDEVERGVDEALVDGGQGRNGHGIAGDAMIVGACLFGAVALIVWAWF